jgi:hypothetical protein
MNWTLIYNTNTGQPVSIGTVISNPLPSGLTLRKLTQEEANGLNDGFLSWDSESLTLKTVNGAIFENGEWFIPIKFSAQEWLEKEGYGPTQLITLLDLQGKLIAANKASQKLDSVRAWTDGILASFVQDESPCSDWGSAPFAFSETVIDAFQQLN